MQLFTELWEQEDRMKLSSRERFLIGVLFTLIIWAVALEVFIWPLSLIHISEPTRP